MKPHLYRLNGTWFCRGCGDIGDGATPSTAFQSWLIRTLQRYDFA